MANIGHWYNAQVQMTLLIQIKCQSYSVIERITVSFAYFAQPASLQLLPIFIIHSLDGS